MASDADPTRGRWADVKREGPDRHGMTREEAAAFCAGKVCAICGTTEDLVADHCHEQGYLREPLCSSHNCGLGFFGDDPELLEAAARYLRKHQRPLPA